MAMNPTQWQRINPGRTNMGKTNAGKSNPTMTNTSESTPTATNADESHLMMKDQCRQIQPNDNEPPQRSPTPVNPAQHRRIIPNDDHWRIPPSNDEWTTTMQIQWVGSETTSSAQQRYMPRFTNAAIMTATPPTTKWQPHPQQSTRTQTVMARARELDDL